MHRNTLRAVALLLLALSLAPAYAQGADPDRPWAKGVKPADQQSALQLFKEGNAALKESLFVDAMKKYREALSHWEHPAIHYNLALVLMNLDQPVEVHRHLIAAMRFGPAPLDSDKFEQAGRFKKLVEAQLATIEVKCDLPGAQVVMDGQTLFTAPGRYEAVVKAGPHAIVASAEGYLTQNQNVKLPAGEKTTVELRLYSASDLTQYRRRWAAWIPWSVIGGGAAALGVGAAMHMSARDGFAAYDRGIADCGAANADDGGGCRPSALLIGQKQGADTAQSVAFVAYGIGAATVVTGSILAYMNRLQPYTVGPGETQVEVTVAPALTPAGGGATALIRF